MVEFDIDHHLNQDTPGSPGMRKSFPYLDVWTSAAASSSDEARSKDGELRSPGS